MQTFDVKQAGTDLLRDQANILCGQYEALTWTVDYAQRQMGLVRDRLIEVRAELGKRRCEAAVAAAPRRIAVGSGFDDPAFAEAGG